MRPVRPRCSRPHLQDARHSRMELANEWKRAGFAQHHSPPRAGRKIDIEMACRSRAVAKQITIGPDDGVADPQTGWDRAERQSIHDDDRSAGDRLRRCRGRGKENCRYGHGKGEGRLHVSAAARCSACCSCSRNSFRPVSSNDLSWALLAEGINVSASAALTVL